MKICILNGDMQLGKSDLTHFLENYIEIVNEKHKIDYFKLMDMNLKSCNGCWNCWLKTPGECTSKDDAEAVFKSVINSDFFILASPLMAGFPSSVLKKVIDRFIVLLHPYIKMKNGESHHKKRYEKYPDMGLLLEEEYDTDNEDIIIIEDIFKRLSLNFHNDLKFTKLINTINMEGFINETNNL